MPVTKTDNENFNSDVKTHQEITLLIDELKEFENKFCEYEVRHEDLVEFVEVVEEFKPISEIKKSSLSTKRKKLFPKLKTKRSIPEETKVEKDIKAATFTFRLNEQGKLENLDARKPKNIPEPKIVKKIKGIANPKKLLSIIRRKKGSGEGDKKEVAEGEKSSGKLSKIKGIGGKLGGIKGKLPKRKK